MIENIREKYSIGALLYSPALNTGIAQSVTEEKYSRPYSLAICLEDTISDDSVEAAEEQLCITLRLIFEEYTKKLFYLPKIFIRVRSSEQMMRLYERLHEYSGIITGFIFPKYTLSNADSYNDAVRKINELSDRIIYMMPILESGDIIDYSARHEVLTGIKEKIDSVGNYVLNIRVGGNDFSNQFSTRRHYDETIYDILPIAQLFGDILTVFSREYVVSGAVWEYFSSENDEWKTGMLRELKLDKLNGFVGKTVIHPKQIDVVNESLTVSRKDYEDARDILNWDKSGLQVGKSFGGERMNEIKTNINWAYKTIILSEIYGIK